MAKGQKKDGNKAGIPTDRWETPSLLQPPHTQEPLSLLQ
jgi:hypothetical protein